MITENIKLNDWVGFIVNVINVPFSYLGNVVLLSNTTKERDVLYQKIQTEAEKRLDINSYWQFIEIDQPFFNTGKATVLFIKVTKQLLQTFQLIREQLEKNKAVLFCVKLTKDPTVCLLTEEGKRIDGNDHHFPSSLKQIIINPPTTKQFTKIKDSDDGLLFLQIFWPKQRIIFIGNDILGKHLNRLTTYLNFQQIKIDWENKLIENNESHLVLKGMNGPLLDNFSFNVFDIIIIFTFDPYVDRDILQFFRGKPFQSIVLPYNKQKTRELLKKRYIPENIISLPVEHLRTKEAAIQIIANIIQLQNGRQDELN
ncbi:hypothetical protein [Bacillus kwashiorkori]|uniref:hypothetical protein n=1 Tax=Bacillus kwashiorkori TaxID=1522318 RepID=UPI000780D209|nr:hypothetical protein [Bacillus kwashiorkori]